MAFDGYESGEDLVRSEEEEIVLRIYFMKKCIFNLNIIKK